MDEAQELTLAEVAADALAAAGTELGGGSGE